MTKLDDDAEVNDDDLDVDDLDEDLDDVDEDDADDEDLDEDDADDDDVEDDEDEEEAKSRHPSSPKGKGVPTWSPTRMMRKREHHPRAIEASCDCGRRNRRPGQDYLEADRPREAC